jgi:hypothetical protein
VNLNADFGFYAQDTWTMRRFTLSPGVRFDYFNSEVPAMSAPAGRFVPERTFEAIKNVPNWKDVSPRLGAAYDLFGNGKTAIKGNIGFYLQSEGTGFANTYNPQIFSTDQRTWNDLNRDDIAQENELGPTQNLAFGVRRNRNADPDIERPYQWLGDIGVQHELAPRLAVAVSYNRRSYHDIIWTDNLAISHSDYTQLFTPDPRGNGEMLPVYNLDRAKLGLINELDTNSSVNTRVYNGFDVSFTYRLGNGGSIFGGTSTGHVLVGTCEVDDPNNLRFCEQSDYDVPMATQFKLAGSYPTVWDIRLSATIQSTPGTEREINYLVNRTIIPTLTQTQVTVRLNEPGTEYNDRVNQLDFSVSRTFRAGRYAFRPELSLFNALNANPVLMQVNNYGPALGNVTGTGVLPPRLLRLGLYLDF